MDIFIITINLIVQAASGVKGKWEYNNSRDLQCLFPFLLGQNLNVCFPLPGHRSYPQRMDRQYYSLREPFPAFLHSGWAHIFSSPCSKLHSKKGTYIRFRWLLSLKMFSQICYGCLFNGILTCLWNTINVVLQKNTTLFSSCWCSLLLMQSQGTDFGST